MSQEKDDPFETIFLSEDRLFKEGYDKGLTVAKSQGCQDGWIVGVTEGVKLGEELGFYLGFSQTMLHCLSQEDRTGRKLRSLDSLLEMVREYQHTNTLSAVRAKFSQVLSLLQLPQSLHPYKQHTSLNF